jgi:glutathione synthase/RimK-type ligase-like ATP-grasp enzyme
MVNKLIDKGVDASWIMNERITPGVEFTDILVRWGCSSSFPSNMRNKIINNTEEMHLVYDKKRSRKLMQENGVSTPKTYFSVEEALNMNNWRNITFPLIIRPRFHSQGEDTTICECPADLVPFIRRDYYISEYIQKEREFRVHVMYNHVLAVTEKIPEDREAICWNEATAGSAFNNVRWCDWPVGLLREASKTTRLLNIDFGGIDFMQKGNTFYCLECNTAPSLSPYRQEVYARGFKYLLNHLEQEGELPPKRTDNSINTYTDIIHPANLL